MNRRLNENDFPELTILYRTLAYMWLRYEQGCYMITFERHPYSDRTNAKPDVLGLNKRRRLIEVEIKVSLSDMKNDLAKPHRMNTGWDIMKTSPTSPTRLYYFVPPRLVADALAILPAYTGVLSVHPYLRDSHSGFPAVALHRRAVALHDNKVSMRTAVDMARDLAGTMTSLLTEMVYILQHHPEHIHNGRLDFDAKRVHAAEKLPKPFTVTPPAAVLDDGSRSGKHVAKADVASVWRERQKELKAPSTSVRRTTK